MSKAIRIHRTGGPEVLVWEDADPGKPGEGQVLIRHNAVGLNYIDVYQRTGLYPMGDLPQTLGMEGSGVVTAVGPGVTELTSGHRIAYAMVPGSYCEERVIDADRLVNVPDGISDQTAAAMMLQGMTARYLLKSSYVVRPGDSILVMAAAGGVGLILCQWAKSLGARVIGCVGSEEKALLAQANGCDHTILYKEEDIAARVRDITGGEGVCACYDSIGQATLEASLDSLRPTGMLVSYGNATGPITGFNAGMLAAKGSLYLQRPTLATYIRSRQLLNECSHDLFDVVLRGMVNINIGQTYPLAETARAHRDLEDRRTSGSTVLLP